MLCILVFFFLMIRRTPRSTRTDTLFPYTTLFRSQMEMLPMQAGDVPDTEADVSELIRAVGYAPKISIDTGIANFVNWYRDYYRSEEHTSELQSLMRISYAVFCLKKKTKHHISKSKYILNYVYTKNN